MFVLGVLWILLLSATSDGEYKPKFRVLAPQFICVSDPSNESVEENTGQTSIRLQTPVNQQATFHWNVRFNILVNFPSQRFTLMVWNVVRDLQRRLNAAAADIDKDNVVGINNSALLAGVEYQFFVWATSDSDPETMSDVQQFGLSYQQDDKDPTLSLEDGDDDSQISLVLAGSDETFAHIPYILEAQVTPCQPTNDYYFVWLVKSLKTEEVLQMDYKRTEVLTIPAYTLVGGNSYEISCHIIKLSDEKFITRGFLTILVKIRGLSVVLNSASLTVEVGSSITLAALVTNYDNLPGPIDYEWTCNYLGEACNDLELSANTTLTLADGFSKEGRYELALCARVSEEESIARLIVLAVRAAPLIEIPSGPRKFNEQECIHINATVSRLVPGCTLTWEHVGGDQETNRNTDILTENTDSLSIISLEENFLSELADYNNVTEETDFPLMVCAAGGQHTFRLEVQCVCTASFECVYNNQSNIHADVDVQVNEAPLIRGISIKPTIVRALQTPVLLTTAAEDDPSDYPLTYKFKYKVGDGEDVTVATYLPKKEIHIPKLLKTNGNLLYLKNVKKSYQATSHRRRLTHFFVNVQFLTYPTFSEFDITPSVEVCDVWSACSSMSGSPLKVLPPDGNDYVTDYLSLMHSQISRGNFIDFWKTAREVVCTLRVLKMDYSRILSTLEEYLISAGKKEQNITVNINNLISNEIC